MVNIVCEGKCNPNLKALDGDLRRAERSDAGIRTNPLTKKTTILSVSLLTAGIVARVRALAHTDHRLLDNGQYECVVCGTKRSF